MMSEKRFKDCFDELGEMWVLDTKTNEEYWTANSLVGLLNEQQATIDYLNAMISAMKLDIKNARQMLKRWDDD